MSTHSLIGEEEISETSVSSDSITRGSFNQNSEKTDGDYLEREIKELKAHSVSVEKRSSKKTEYSRQQGSNIKEPGVVIKY